MLVAQQQNGELLMLTETVAAEQLKLLRQQQSFYCPQCHAPLTLKVGRIKIPHFAHHKNSACEQAFSEGESLHHVLGKQQLYAFFEQHKLNVKLEYSLPLLMQRPDLFVEHNSLRYAIEFQCSRISSEIFHLRTRGYRHAQIEPTWILRTPKTIHAPGIVRHKFDEFQKLFIQHHRDRPFILTYCPEQQNFSYISPIFHVHKNTYITVVEQLPINYQRFPFLRPKAISYERFVHAFKLHQQYLQSYLESTMKYNRQGMQNLFLRYMYELRLTLVELPAFLKLPILNNEQMGVLSSGWQCALFYFTQQLGKPPWALKMSEVELFFTSMSLPLNAQTIEVLKRYVLICKCLNITSHRSYVDEERLLKVLYSEYLNESEHY